MKFYSSIVLLRFYTFAFEHVTIWCSSQPEIHENGGQWASWVSGTFGLFQQKYFGAVAARYWHVPQIRIFNSGIMQITTLSDVREAPRAFRSKFGRRKIIETGLKATEIVGRFDGSSTLISSSAWAWISLEIGIGGPLVGLLPCAFSENWHRCWHFRRNFPPSAFTEPFGGSCDLIGRLLVTCVK